MTNRISRKCQYPRKKNGSKRRSRRNKSVKYRFTTRRKMNKMTGGDGSWECTCRDPIDGEISNLKPVTTEVSPAAPPMPAAAVLPAAAAAATAAILEKFNIAKQIAVLRSSTMKHNLQIQLEQLLQQQKKLQEQGKALEPLLDNEIKNLQEQLMHKHRPQYPRPLNVLYEQIPPPTPPLSRPRSVSTVLQPRMIRENSNGTYQIDSREKLPEGFTDGDIILSIDGYPATRDNIDKLYGGDSGKTAVVTVINPGGGTRAGKIRTITIQYS